MGVRLLITIVLGLVLPGSSALALGRPENVLVVQNGNSPVSMRIASYYINQRGIPTGNLVTINVPDSSTSSANENISLSNYTSQIEEPIRSFLSTSGLTNQIQYIVLTKGIPIRLTNDPPSGSSGGRCVDSVLAGIDLMDEIAVDFYTQTGTYIATVSMNRFWLAKVPFTHSQYGGYLVTRLDGYTEANAKALVDRAMALQTVPYYILLDFDPDKGAGNPAIQPKSLLLPDGTLDETYELHYYDYNADMTRAYEIISARPHLSVQLENTTAFVSNTSPLSGYVSWGSNDSHYVAANYNALTFAPGGIAETAVSSSGRTFLPTTGGQSLIADLLAQGVSGGKGYVTEPYLDSIASPSVLLDLYTSGRNLAESYYAASRFLKWKDIVLGDPLCALAGTTVSTIAAAKALPNGTLVTVSGMVVTAGTDDFADRFYIEEQERSSGIQVYLGTSFSEVTRGSIVAVRGIMGTRNGERVILNPGITTTALPPSPAPRSPAVKTLHPPRMIKVRLQRLKSAGS